MRVLESVAENATGASFNLRLAGGFFRAIVDRIYSRFEDVVREFFVDFYEADVERLDIWMPGNGEIVFEGRGRYAGMSAEELEAFLTLGTAYKREAKFSRHFRRRFAGEHGIGRMSAFKFYRRIRVESEKDGVAVAFEIDESHLDALSQNPYSQVEMAEFPPKGQNYTKISLLDPIDPSKVPPPERVKSYIRTNLFPMILNPKGPFQVAVNGEEVRGLEEAAKPEVKIEVREPVDGETLEGEIAVYPKPVPQEVQGILLLIRGSPICRKSLGELAGKRSVDSAIPPDRVTGYVDAPFLKPTASRDWVDESHASFAEFKAKMLRVAGKVLRAVRQSEVLRASELERAAIGEAVAIFSKAVRAEHEIAGMLGEAKVAANLFDKIMGLPPVKPARPERQSSARLKPKPAAGKAASNRRRSLGLIVKVEELNDEDTPYVFTPPQGEGLPAVFSLNTRNPLYVERRKKRWKLRNYALLMLAKGVSEHVKPEYEANKIYSRLVRRLEAILNAQLF